MAAPSPRRAPALKEAMTKTQLIASLSEATGLPKKDVSAVLDELGVLIERHIKKRSVGTFTLPGLLRIVRARKPARKARTMVSPRTGEEIQVAAKPGLDGGQGPALGGAQADGGIASSPLCPSGARDPAAHPGM